MFTLIVVAQDLIWTRWTSGTLFLIGQDSSTCRLPPDLDASHKQLHSPIPITSPCNLRHAYQACRLSAR
jgi:hypothetical protein